MATATATLPGRARRQQLSDIVNESLPTVRFLASRLASRIPPHVDVDDLVQVGLMGLLKSADRFDPRRGVKFQTYASRRVQGAMLDYLRSLDWKPRSVRTRRRKLEKAYHDAEQRLGGRASEEDVAQEIGISLPELESWMGNSVGSPAWSQTEECISEETLEQLADPAETPEAAMQKQEMRKTLVRAIERLPKNERLVLSLYYYEQLTMKEIGEMLGVRQARISQLHSQAVARLRNRLGSTFKLHSVFSTEVA